MAPRGSPTQKAVGLAVQGPVGRLEPSVTWAGYEDSSQNPEGPGCRTSESCHWVTLPESQEKPPEEKTPCTTLNKMFKSPE